MIGKAMVCAAALGVTQIVGAAVLVDSFESGVFTAGGTKVVAQSTTGVTNGSFSMAITDSDTSWAWVGKSYDATTYAAWKANPIIKIDLQDGPSATGHNIDVYFAMNSDGTGAGWTQTGIITSWPWLNAGATNAQTLMWDTSSIAATAGTNGTWWQLNIMVRTGQTPQTFYFDNLRLEAIPEPATLALVGTPAVLLLMRRRSQQA